MFVFKTYLVCLSLCTRFVFSEGRTFRTSSPSVCPKHQGSDPNDVNDRMSKFADKDSYTTQDQDYKYIINICKKSTGDSRAVQQHGFKWKFDSKWTTVGTYEGAHVTGGNDWLMIKYFHGDKYFHHCSGVERMAVVLITCDPGEQTYGIFGGVKWTSVGTYDGAHVTGGTNWLMIKYFHGEKYIHHCSGVERMAVLLIVCDPGEQRGTVKIIEEYRNRSSPSNPLECYYLFELNHDAACSSSVMPKHLSPGSICLIILIVMGSVYFLLGFLYQRYVVGAKGLEQIPNCCFWTNFACLRAGGCNCLCPCSESSPMTSQAWTTHSNDDQDERSLPILM